MAAVPAHAHSRSSLPFRNIGTHGIECSDDFMSGHARILDAWESAGHGKHVTVADAAGLHLDSYLPRTRRWYLALDQLQRAVGVFDVNSFHARHGALRFQK